MRKLVNPLAIAAIVASSTVLVAAAPASASPSQVRVDYRDLDLGTDAGRRALRHRIGDAVNRVCPVERQLDLTAACHRAAMENVSIQLANVGADS